MIRTRHIHHILATSLLTVGVLVVAAPAAQAHNDNGGHDLPLGSMYHVVDQIGARELWQQGITGDGVTVAIIDTGVVPVTALSEPDKVVAAVDLSAEAGVPEATYLDTYGHGTHVAGIIAGHTPGTNPATAEDHPEWFMGVAPEASLVSVKVADNTGAADISQVIAGVDWVVEHADELDIRVLNLSYTSRSPLDYLSDPLTFALERAWNAGLVVVVAAGNDGWGAHGLASPANDPYVIAAGAVEAVDESDFVVPSWASSGDGVRNPDVAAPGAHIDSLRVPASRVDQEHPEGYVSDTLFRGSGSSQAAAVVSGAAALLLDAQPNLTNDQVKALLQRKTEQPTPRWAALAGAGVIQLDEIYQLRAGASTQTFAAAVGDGSIEAARGGQHVVYNGTEITGEITALGTSWTGTSWTGDRWTSGTWNGTSWTGGTWMGTSWTGTSWTGTSWTGTSWTGTSWTGTSWTGTSWTGTSWTGTSWTETTWG
ncbi:MAG: S8 family serine peptidase [Actinomycetota bacterium]|nr:S8 family serine peptidase [Actinomycetota bacterium]